MCTARPVASADWILSASERSRSCCDMRGWPSIGGDGDPRDAVTLQRAAVDPLDRAAELAGGLILIARDHQHARDARLAVGAGEKIIKLLRARNAAHGKVRHRLAARRAPTRRGFARLAPPAPPPP